MNSRIVALAIALSVPSPALADLILVEDNRFIEISQDGEVRRLEPPGSLSWDWTAELLTECPLSCGRPLAQQYAAFSGTTLEAGGGTSAASERGISKEAHSTFDVRFRVDRPTVVSLSGEFFEPVWPDTSAFGVTARLLFMEDSALLLSAPTGPPLPMRPAIRFKLDAILRPESVYHLFIEGSAWEDYMGGTPELIQTWYFTLELPELPAVALLPLVLAAARWRRR